MTKAELISAIAEKAGITKAAAGDALAAVVEAVEVTLRAGEKITIQGFGTFSVAQRAARTGVNPQTGAKVEIKAARAPKFKAAKGLKDSLQ